MLRQIISLFVRFAKIAVQFRWVSPKMGRSPLVKDLFLCLLSVFLLILSFPGFNFWVFTWFAFIPLFLALKNKSKVKAFIFSYITGVLFWLATIYWLIHVTFLGMFFLVLYLALYFGVFGFVFCATHNTQYAVRLFFIPAAWVLLEYSRSHLFTGFPWALLGYSQFLNLPAIQIADIFGVWGVSFIVILVNIGFYLAMSKKSSAVLKIKNLIVPVIILALVLGYGYFKLHPVKCSQSVINHSIKISVIQGNIPQELKWNPLAREDILNKYLFLSQLASKEKPDLIVWPEAALPVILEEEPAYFERVRVLAKLTRVLFLLGAVTVKEGLYYNSAILVSKEGAFAGQYNKIHLVPFGEYIPLRNIFPFLQTIAPIGEVNQGKEYTIFSVNSAGSFNNSFRLKFGVLICFEDAFPELSRQFVKKGARFLVNITNDAWYKDTFAPDQHFQSSVFRAVENRVNVLRSANTGISGFISPEGKIISQVTDASGKKIFVDGYKMQSILIIKGSRSFYANYGDWFVLLCSIFVLGSIIILWVRGVLLHQ